jgi:hypothetical protein
VWAVLAAVAEVMIIDEDDEGEREGGAGKQYYDG